VKERAWRAETLEMSNADRACKRVRNDAALCMTGTHVDIWSCSITSHRYMRRAAACEQFPSQLTRRRDGRPRSVLEENPHASGRVSLLHILLVVGGCCAGGGAGAGAGCSCLNVECVEAWAVSCRMPYLHCIRTRYYSLAPGWAVQDRMARCSYCCCSALIAACCLLLTIHHVALS
jgi:hypothetical protein